MTQKVFIFSAFLLALSFNSIGQVKTVDFSDFHSRITNPEADSIYVINFWATWCGPCVKELPEFKEAQENQSITNIKYIFVSLDFPGKEKEVGEFFLSKGLEGEVVMFNDTDANEWIDKVQEDWQGNIPVTWFLNPAKKFEHFHSGTITTEEITIQIKTINNIK